MLLSKQNHTRTRGNTSEDQMLYSNSDAGRGRDHGRRNCYVCERKKVESDIDLWHKRFGHINFPQLSEMITKNIVFGLPKFSGRNGQVYEAWQLGSQHRLPFPNERNRSRNRLDLIHCDVWDRHRTWASKKLLFCILHQWLQSTHMGMLAREEERSLHLFPEGEEPCWTGNRKEDQVA